MVYSKELPIKCEVDVCVVGGGPAGIAAAVTAARNGASVFIIEATGCFGGAATAALVPTFVSFTDGVHFLAGGIGKEISDACQSFSPNCMTGRNVGYDVETLRRFYDNMVLNAGIKFLFFSRMVDVISKDGRVEALVVSSKSGLYAVKAKFFIDCTGDGDVCAMAGNPYEFGDKEGNVMGASLCSTWIGVDWTKEQKGSESEVERALADGIFTQEDRHIPGIYKNSEDTGGGNLTHVFGVDATKEEDLTRGMIIGRRITPEFQTYFNKYLGGAFEHARVITTAQILGIRESRRIMGDYVLTEQDYDNRAIFEDEIGRYSYPIDIHESKEGKAAYDKFFSVFRGRVYNDGESYGIPFRCLLPQKLKNVYVAGRCLSVDRIMHSSTRVMPCSFITGQAVGMASALSIKKNYTDIRKLNISELQDELVKIGAYLPNHQ